MTDRGTLLADFLAGGDDVEAVELVRDALRRWSLSDGAIPLQRFVGLRTPQEFRRQERDRWLIGAAVRVGGHTRHECARRLLGAVVSFRRRWPLLRDLAEPPSTLDAVSFALFFAFRSGAQTPGTIEGLARILGEAFSEESFAEGALESNRAA